MGEHRTYQRRKGLIGEDDGCPVQSAQLAVDATHDLVDLLVEHLPLLGFQMRRGRLVHVNEHLAGGSAEWRAAGEGRGTGAYHSTHPIRVALQKFLEYKQLSRNSREVIHS